MVDKPIKMLKLSMLMLSCVCLQGVMKVRKRVTLMAVTVTAIFGVCYLSDSTIFLFRHYDPKHTDVGEDVNSALVMLNSAINPIVYVLVNQRFREKIKAIMCCACRPSTNRVPHGTPDQRMVVVNRTIPPI